MELRFVEYSPNSYLTTFVELLRRGARKFLVRGFRPEAVAFAAQVEPLRRDYGFTLCGYDHDPKIDYPRSLIRAVRPGGPPGAIWQSDEGFDAVFIFSVASLPEVLLEFAGLKGSVTVVAPNVDRGQSSRKAYVLSIPKAGTHLLIKLVELFGLVVQCPRKLICAFPHATPDYLNTFNMSWPELVDFDASPAAFIYRDPRDVATSLLHWSKRPDAPQHWIGSPHVLNCLNSFGGDDERLLKIITGTEDPAVKMDSIRVWFLRHSGWLRFRNVHPVRFEDLVGTRGGGTVEFQIATIWRLQLAFRVPGNPADFADRIFDREVYTFRKGMIGSYREDFKEMHYQAFNSLNQDFMAIYGYK